MTTSDIITFLICTLLGTIYSLLVSSLYSLLVFFKIARKNYKQVLIYSWIFGFAVTLIIFFSARAENSGVALRSVDITIFWIFSTAMGALFGYHRKKLSN